MQKTVIKSKIPVEVYNNNNIKQHEVSIDRVECFYDSKFYNSFTYETLHGGAMVMCTQHTYIHVHAWCAKLLTLSYDNNIIVVACIIRSILV